MIRGILFIAIAIASMIAAPAFLTYPVTAQNDTSTTDGTTTDGTTTDGTTTDGTTTDGTTTDGTTTDGTTTDGTTTDGTTTDGGMNATSADTTFNKVTAKFKGSNYKWDCVPSSGSSFKVAVEDGTVVSASRSSGPGLQETKNWGGYLRLEGVTDKGTTYVKEANPSKSDMTGSAGSKNGFSITGTITKDNLCSAPHVGATQAGNLSSTELGELSEVGKSIKIEGPCNEGSGTITVTAGGKSKTFGHTDIECHN